MYRRMKFVALIAVGALVGAACADASVVATVNDVSIEGSSVAALRHSFQDTSTVAADGYRGDLTNLIFVEAEKDAAEEDFGLSGLDDPERIEQKRANPGPLETQVFEAVEADPDRTEASIDVLAEALIIRDVVTRALLIEDETLLRNLYATQLDQMTQVCARHILVPTEEEAETARERLVDGEDFAVVAADVSLDTGSPGGQLPCPAAATTYVEELVQIVTTSPVGEITEPFETQFGWHIVVVDDRVAPESVDELLADPVTYVDPTTANQMFSVWLQEAIGRANIEVRSQIGEWVPEAGGIVPPPSG
jgi:parvulin-like peptidyl-prolyl isomerase